MARNFARSSSGSSRVLGEGEHPGVEVEPRQLAVEEPLGRSRSNGGWASRESLRPSVPATGRCYSDGSEIAAVRDLRPNGGSKATG